ncbi:MAG: hypothetical protein COA42_12415 [Alteromonadaceae bacterium]|nr:MAG: hypothetical protein COA42_12415 [Alteromonadaceae bacterium]
MGFKALCFLFCYIACQFSVAQVANEAAPPLGERDVQMLRFQAVDDEVLGSIGEIRAITQDKQGFMWFAGPNGLARYDGYSVKLYLHQPDKPGEETTSVSTNAHNDLLVDKGGFLWVASYWGLNRYDPTLDQFTRYLTDPDDPTSISNNSVMSLIQGQDGSLWIGTAGGGLNRFNYDTETFERFWHDEDDPDSLGSDAITDLFEDNEGNIWVGTKDRGLDRFNPSASNIRFTHYPHVPEKADSLSHNNVISIAADEYGQIWIATIYQLNRFDNGNFVRYKMDLGSRNRLNTDNSNNIYLDHQNRLWIPGKPQGLHVYRPKTDDFYRYVNHEVGLPSNEITTMYSDNAGGLWLGHKPYGVSKIDRYASAFHNYTHVPGDDNSLSSSDVLAVAEDENANLWVGTSDGFNFIDRKSGRVTRYMARDDGLPSNAITALLVDRKNLVDGEGNLWIGTPWRGITRFGLESGRYTHYLPGPDGNSGLMNNEIWSLYKSSDDQMWAGANKGFLHRYDREQDKFSALKVAPPNKQYPSRILALYEDNLGELWVGSDDGLFTVSSPGGQWRVRHFPEHSDHIIDLSVPALRAISQDLRGSMWFGTEGGGLNVWDKRADKFRVYLAADGLAHDTIAGIVEDDQGNMWFSTSNGISRFNHETDTFQTYSKRHGLPGNLFNHSVFLKTVTGELVFGGVGGVSIFDPNNIFENKRAPEVVITDFQVFNKPLAIQRDKEDEYSPLKQAITHTKSIVLDHHQSVFSFYFSALNYDIPEMNQYAYKMEGFDQDWNYVNTRRTATYTNLNPGRYVFNVKASNNEGVWSESSVAIDIVILPPWWDTWWAKVCYLVLFVAFFALVIYTILQKRSAEGERKVNQKLRDLDKVKDSFLANTSHELRTPLNGVIGLSESLIAGVAGTLPKNAVDNLELIVSSSKRLAYLIDDILDFTKLKGHSLSLNRTSIDLRRLVESIFKLTHPLLETKSIELTNNVDKFLPSFLADENRLQQILCNLVGNAIKFTNEGQVSVSTLMIDGLLWIEIADSGVGISEEKLEDLFTPVEQSSRFQDKSADVLEYGGTGFGLTVSKQLVELHGGLIDVISREGLGTKVRFSLTHSNKVMLDEDSIALELAIKEAGSNPGSQGVTGGAGWASFTGGAEAANKGLTGEHDENTVLGKRQYHVLVVDDEPINRKVLQNLLSFIPCRVSECATGMQAINLLNTNVSDDADKIDLVLLDIMMPGINGYDVCKALRKTYSANELPIVFLSAKSQVSDLEAGYAAGGNDFLNKPIAKEELYARLKTHLKLLDVHSRIGKEVALRTKELERSYYELKQTQGQLLQAEKMSSLGTLVTGVGHEINNPVTYVNVAAANIEQDLFNFQEYVGQLVGDEQKDVAQSFSERFERMSEHLSSLQNSTQRINEIVGNLHTFSNGGESSLPVDDSYGTEVSCISEGLISTLELVRANYKSDIHFDYDIKDDPEIPCSAPELNQVFMNLMLNACQAMSQLDTKDDENREPMKLHIVMERIHSGERGEELGISFKDNGCGMTDESIQRIYEPFFTTQPDGKGVGLGMSISFGIVERHNGRFDIESSLGSGTLIRLYLPLN